MKPFILTFTPLVVNICVKYFSLVRGLQDIMRAKRKQMDVITAKHFQNIGMIN